MGKKSRRNGFTLIELLIVLGLIVLLFSILIPTFTKFQNESDLQRCTANLRQNVQALYLYAADNNNWLPFQAVNPAAPTDADAQSVYVDFGGIEGLQHIGSKYKFINRYLSRAASTNTSVTEEQVQKLYQCPADNGAYKVAPGGKGGTAPGSNLTESAFKQLGYSYLYNSTGNTNHWNSGGLYMKKISQVKYPTVMIGFVDASFGAWILGLSNPPYRWTFWHDKVEAGWGNVAFMDGHVQYICFLKSGRVPGQTPVFYSQQRGPGWSYHISYPGL